MPEPAAHRGLRRRFVRRVAKQAGQPPGTLSYEGERGAPAAALTVTVYDAGTLAEKTLEGAEALPAPGKPPAANLWVNLDGLHDVSLVAALGRRFEIHPLTLEDILNTGHRPKAEDFGRYLFVVLKMLTYDGQRQQVNAEQVSLVLGEGWLVSFQERAGDVFGPVRERLRRAGGRIRTAGCDYLAYALIDAVVDHYFTVLDRLGEEIESLEVELLEAPAAGTMEKIHHLKREMIFMRKQTWPLREVVATLLRDDSPLITEATRVYLRDVFDHLVHVTDTIESLRDMLSGMLDLYLSTVSNRMNEVMKVLTIIATIFIPLTFIAGIYGMNFEYMPELKWRWAYPVLLVVLAALGLGMLWVFRRRRWL